MSAGSGRRSGSRYDAHKARAAGVQRELSAAGREIGPLPPVADPDRRNLCLDDPELFNLTYFPARFPLPFSAAHREAMARLARCTADQGLFALAFQRGGGKTTLAECEVLRAILYGFRRFVVLVQATEQLASRSMKKILRELETNDLLYEDFPEVCHPIRALERIHTRTRGQTLGGEPTWMEWTANGVVLPRVPGSAASGAVIHVAGLTGAVRGLSYAGPAGEVMRPDLVILDDCQTRESAKSPTQTADREAIICDDVLGLSGPGSAVAAVHLCTPIYPNDLAERFLDPERHPEWNGLRTKMMPKPPDRSDLWDRYAELLREGLRAGDGGAGATAFYRANRPAMDIGAVVTWPERTTAREVSAASGVELAMKLSILNPRGFAAEYQCEPEAAEVGAGVKCLDPREVAGRLSGCERRRVPRECTRLTAGVDVGEHVHWYAVVAWTERFGGSVVDYGCWPRQSRAVFAARDARPSLADAYPGLTAAQRVYAGLKDLVPDVFGRVYFREGGGELTAERGLVDSGDQTAAVYQYVRQSPHAGVLYPSKGFGRSFTSAGVGKWKLKPGEKPGYHCKLTVGDDGRGRAVQFDADEWKTLLWDRLTVPMGGGTDLTLFGRSAGAHELFAEHCGAEYGEPATVKGETFVKWAARPDRPDNHFWDALVLAAVAAGIQGLRPSAADGAAAAAGGRPVPKGKASDILARRRAERARGAGV